MPYRPRRHNFRGLSYHAVFVSARFHVPIGRSCDPCRRKQRRVSGGVDMMSMIGHAIMGLIIGLVARAVMPGRQHMGLILTMLLGMVGAWLGGSDRPGDRHVRGRAAGRFCDGRGGSAGRAAGLCVRHPIVHRRPAAAGVPLIPKAPFTGALSRRRASTSDPGRRRYRRPQFRLSCGPGLSGRQSPSYPQ